MLLRRFTSLDLIGVSSLESLANPLSNFLIEKLPQNASYVEAAQNLKRVEGETDQAKATLYPEVRLDWKMNQTEMRRDFRDELSAQATQSLFAGGTEYATLKKNRLLREQAQANFKDTQDTLLGQLSLLVASYNLQRDRIEVLQQNKKAQDERIRELQRRVRLGQSREPDLLQAQVETSRLERRLVSAQELEANLGQELRTAMFLSDIEFQSLQALLNKNLLREHFQSQLNARDSYKIKSIELGREILEAERSSIWRDALPKLDLYGNQYFSQIQSNTNKWEFGLRAQWTLFEGFKTPAQLREAAAKRAITSKQLDTMRFQRQEAVSRLQREAATLESKKKSIQLDIGRAERALSQQRRDYRLGLVTSLEVEQTLQSLLELKLELLDLKQLGYELKVKRFLWGELPT